MGVEPCARLLRQPGKGDVFMLIKQISVFVENKPGRLSEITDVLAKNQINLRALSIADTTDFGILRLIVNDPDRAMSVIRDAGFTASLTNVLAVSLRDETGALAGVMQTLYEAQITVEYIYAFIGAVDQQAYVIIRVEDNDGAIRAMQKRGIELLDAEKIYSM